MAKIIQLHIWMQNRRATWTDKEVLVRQPSTGKMVPHVGKRIMLDVETDSVSQMKMAVAEVLKDFLPQIKYYYVVAVAQREDGTIGYRTIVPKVVL